MNKIFALLSLICFGWVGALNAQPQTQPYQTVQRVFSQLLSVCRTTSVESPVLSAGLSTTTTYGAKWDNGVITIEQKLFDICMAQGKDSLNALAFIIGHELGHHYQKHLISAEHLEQFGNAAADAKVKEAQSLIQEAEADYYGGIWAHLAGYKVTDAGVALMDAFYKGYGFGDNLPGYPSLQDRKTELEKTHKKIEAWADCFDMANYLMLLGNYEEAAICFDKIIKDCQIREVCLNAGVNACFAAIQEDEFNYAWPIVIEGTSPLRTRDAGNKNVDFFVRAAWLEKARYYLRLAQSYEEKNPVVLINLACVYGIEGDNLSLNYYAALAERYAAPTGNKYLLDGVKLMRGILKAKEGDLEGAKNIWSGIESASAYDHLALINLKALTDKNGAAAAFAGMRFVRPRVSAETFNRVNVSSLYPDAGFGSFDLSPYIKLETKHQSGMDLLVYSNYKRSPSKEFKLQIIRAGYQKPTAKGVKIGDAEDTLVKLMGNSPLKMNASHGIYYFYPSSRLIFWVKEGRVSEWVSYYDPEFD